VRNVILLFTAMPEPLAMARPTPPPTLERDPALMRDTVDATDMDLAAQSSESLIQFSPFYTSKPCLSREGKGVEPVNDAPRIESTLFDFPS